MLPIATVQGVRDGISTGMIIDLSEYLKKTEGVSKEEMQSLESVVANKLDIEPQHTHHIEDIKQLNNVLNGKYDKSEKYSYNVILNDSEKIPYLENPKIKLMELVQNKETEGYKFYVDESNGDLMIILNDVLIGTYSKSGNKWVLSGLESGADINHTHDEYASVSHRHDEIYYSKTEVDNKIDNSKTEALTMNTLNTKFGFNNFNILRYSSDFIGDKSIDFYFDEYNGLAILGNNGIILDRNDKNEVIVYDMNITAKINELENILQNHYQALMLLLEKHDMVDTNTNDGANITAGTQ